MVGLAMASSSSGPKLPRCALTLRLEPKPGGGHCLSGAASCVVLSSTVLDGVGAGFCSPSSPSLPECSCRRWVVRYRHSNTPPTTTPPTMAHWVIVEEGCHVLIGPAGSSVNIKL